MAKRRLHTEYDGPEVSPGFLLWQLSNKWQAEQRKALAPFDLTHVQFVLLACLVWADGATTFTQKQLAAYAQTDVMMTSQVVRVLERKGLITRSVSTQDGRSFLLRQTAAGITLANKAVVAVESVDKQFFGILGKETPRFATAMRRLIG